MLSLADTCVSYAGGTLTYNDVTTVLGGLDFTAIASFCDCVLQGETGRAFEQAEEFLSAGKSIGVLVKDVMNSAGQIMEGMKESTGIDIQSLLSGILKKDGGKVSE